MNLPFGQVRRRHAALSCSFLVVAVATTVSVLGEERDADPAGKAAAGEASGADSSAAEVSTADGTAKPAGELSGVLSEMTDRELLSLARGGELPAKLRGFANSAQVSEALLRELAKRWSLHAGPPATGIRSTERSVAVAREKRVDSQPDADPRPGHGGPLLTSTTVEVVSGIPYSVGLVELKFAEGRGPTFYRDQPLFLDSSGQRTHYTTFDVAYQQRAGEPTAEVDRLRVLFLLRGDQASDISLTGLDGVELENRKLRFRANPVRHEKLLREWWELFSVIPEELDREQKMLKRSLLEMLARRTGLPGPWPSDRATETPAVSGLESQFERAIGMLFGIESVKLALQGDANLNRSRDGEKATLPVPARPRMRSLPVPPVPPATRIESIAMHVPAECFYLRTGSLANYRYFRRFLLGWGGSLDDIVATRSLDPRTRSRIELQLGLDSDTVSTLEFDQSISDMALIGCDPFFQDGAAIGVLFQTRQPEELFREIQKQRQQAKRRVPEVIERRVDIGNHSVSLLASDDHRVRSFYAIDGDYHLVTNSRHLLNRFFEAGKGDRSLGALKEFRYARSKTQNHRDALAFFYLSDPFFQNLVSPQYRIELTRRRQAVEELKQLHLARMVADAEQLDAVTVAQLIAKRLLPPDFANRPDNSMPLMEDGKLRDSRRGSPLAFLPVPDVPLDKVTPGEVHSYQRFLRQYNREWKRVDPVTVVFSRRDSRFHDRDWVNLDIVIAPYAQNRYSLLRRHLAAANPQRVAPVDGDLLSLDTSLRIGSGKPWHLLYLGLRDDNVPFAFENGSLRLLDRPQQGSYAKSHSYAAISPPSTDVVRVLASLVDGQSGQQVSANPPTPPTHAVPPPGFFLSPGVGQAFYYLGWEIGKLALKLDELSKYVSSVETREDWTVVSNHRKIRKNTFPKLIEEYVEASPQVRLRMGSLRGAKVEPYIRAYTYLAARRGSAENARFLNDFSRWMHLPAKDAKGAAESVLGAHIGCPLGGDFALDEGDGLPRWVGTEWRDASLHTVSKTPDSWRSPFLDWVHRLDLRFDLGPTTLRAQVDLLVSRVDDPAVDGKTAGMRIVDPPHSIAGVSHLADRRTWVLGIRLATSGQSMRITEVYPNSPASRAGLQTEDALQTIDGERPRSHTELRRLLRAALEGDGVAVVQVGRRGSTHTFRIPLFDR